MPSFSLSMFATTIATWIATAVIGWTGFGLMSTLWAAERRSLERCRKDRAFYLKELQEAVHARHEPED